jgi:hypothetical protein
MVTEWRLINEWQIWLLAKARTRREWLALLVELGISPGRRGRP